jgi:methylthioribose-1-phosphate isomerase
MNIHGTAYRSIWLHEDGCTVCVINQRKLPHAFEIARLTTLDDAAEAIRDMIVRGAPLIGATAAWGMFLALRVDGGDESVHRAVETLLAARPTAVNLPWAVHRVQDAVGELPEDARADAARATAETICDEDVQTNRAIGGHGLALLDDLQTRAGRPINLLTHCNAGWLATVDWGTALAPIYLAHDAGIPVHVWVDETRPRNQGASLTAWELQQHGVPHTVIVDSAGGHLMQRGLVDACITGADRVTADGDVCNKIGTYLKALAAHDNGVPFYVALPGTTIDFSIRDGIAEVPIEERAADEVTTITGRGPDDSPTTVLLTPPGTDAANWAFDITPARLVTALITERGIGEASRAGLAGLYPDRASGKDAFVP